MDYDNNNVFAKILRGELPCEKVYETDHSLAFQDISPQAKVHVLVIPKGRYCSWDDFSSNASDKEKIDYVTAIGATARALGVDTSGYRILGNHGRNSHQEVQHLHIHILAGQPLGPMLEDGDLPPNTEYLRSTSKT
ncbi:MAG: putative HIT-like protein [Alphaproteobacteria bacterium MarineAlpha11_Bin1]|nr:MAG: putative HIT-like protein [Alphaproteobacteria bacterium MarineAlpha11_Bin1]|tara:strand:+ start:5080 stop:5487 length:408 start_codon:yes stop_codon:yes gene_type:complete